MPPGVTARRDGAPAWALLDQQTNTFSLSKVQLLMWMVTIVYCFVLLQSAYVFVQGKLQMAPLPENSNGFWGSLVHDACFSDADAISGPKGGGAPSGRSPISSPLEECSQRIGHSSCCGQSSGAGLPAGRSSLADGGDRKNAPINTDLLNAMGITALVNIGGKSVRLPGPVVNQVTAAFRTRP